LSRKTTFLTEKRIEKVSWKFVSETTLQGNFEIPCEGRNRKSREKGGGKGQNSRSNRAGFLHEEGEKNRSNAKVNSVLGQ